MHVDAPHKRRNHERVQPVRDLEPTFEFVGPMPFPALNSMFDQFYPSGLQWYWRADFINEIPDEAVAEEDGVEA